MAMVDIGDMNVLMLQCLMLMVMAVAKQPGQRLQAVVPRLVLTKVTMLMMPLAMPVPVRVAGGSVYVTMSMPLRQEQQIRQQHQGQRPALGQRERLAEHHEGQQQAKQRRRREKQLSARGAQALSGGDVQHDAGAIGQRSNAEG